MCETCRGNQLPAGTPWMPKGLITARLLASQPWYGSERQDAALWYSVLAGL
jgi:hypothetical protein